MYHSVYCHLSNTLTQSTPCTIVYIVTSPTHWHSLHRVPVYIVTSPTHWHNLHNVPVYIVTSPTLTQCTIVYIVTSPTHWHSLHRVPVYIVTSPTHWLTYTMYQCILSPLQHTDSPTQCTSVYCHLSNTLTHPHNVPVYIVTSLTQRLGEHSRHAVLRYILSPLKHTNTVNTEYLVTSNTLTQSTQSTLSPPTH